MPIVRGVREYKYYNDEVLDEQLSVEELQAFRLSQVPVFNPAVTIAPVEEALTKLPKNQVDVEDTKENEEYSGRDSNKEPFQFYAEDDLPIPNITVALEGVGEIELPLKEETIHKLIDVSSKIKTNDADKVVEPKNYGAPLIPASELKVNFHEEALNSMLKKISCCLNIDSKCVLQPEMRCLYIHTPEQFLGWQIQQDDEDSCKFVRLEIVLPSCCGEGQLSIKHGGHTHKSFTSDSTVKWVAFYADCAERESGHRVVLQYDLVLQYPASLEPWDAVDDVDESLNNAVAHHFSNSTRLIVLLRGRYAEDTLAWQRTKGRDRTYARALLSVAGRQGLRASLALGTCLETWESSGYHGPVRNGGSLDLRLWVDEAGRRTSEVVTIDYEGMAGEVCSLGGELWSQREPDREVMLGWYGEGAAIREQWYHKACVVLSKEE